jgi:hypothetical protein
MTDAEATRLMRQRGIEPTLYIKGAALYSDRQIKYFIRTEAAIVPRTLIDLLPPAEKPE